MEFSKIATGGEKIELVIEGKISDTQKESLLSAMYNSSIVVYRGDVRDFLLKELNGVFYKVKISGGVRNIWCLDDKDKRVANLKISSSGRFLYKKSYMYKSSYIFDSHEDFLKKFPDGKQTKIKKTQYVCETIRIDSTRLYSCKCCGYFKPAWEFHADLKSKITTTLNLCLICSGSVSRFKNIENIPDIWIKIDALKEIAKEYYLLEDKITISDFYKEERDEIYNRYCEIVREILTIENDIKYHRKKIQYREELEKIVKPLTVEENKEGIYLIYHKKLNCYKIGISKNPIRRISDFKNNFDIECEDCELLDFRNPKIGRAIDTEKKFIHYDLKHINVKYLYPNLGVEWFDGAYKDLIFEVYYKYTLEK